MKANTVNSIKAAYIMSPLPIQCTITVFFGV